MLACAVTGSQIRQFIIERCPVPLWLRRIGLAGFLFFFIKGMLWLIVPAVLVFFGTGE
ncbi:MAG: hypothetical protein AB1810_14695 [Pseudomonadota bacterium]